MALHIDFTLTNPFKDDSFAYNVIFHKEWRLSKHKEISLQLNGWDVRQLIGVGFWIMDSKMDHKGVLVNFDCMLFGITINFYDIRYAEDY